MPTMQGKICLITGATNGIGKVTALELARMGATVVIAGRNPEKTAHVVAEIKSKAGNDKVESLLADLSSQKDIHRLADEFKSTYTQLHVLINNAGVVWLRRELTVDGIERTFAVNHLAYFLLTNLLLDVIKASAPARIINVSSNAHRGGTIDFDNLQGEKSYAGFKAYGSSKLANILFTIELAHRLDGTGVTVNCLHPGFVNTGFGGNNSPALARIYGFLAGFIARTPEKGAETTIYLASSPQVDGVTGKYFYDCQSIQPAPQAMDMAVAQKLWDVSASMVHLDQMASR